MVRSASLIETGLVDARVTVEPSTFTVKADPAGVLPESRFSLNVNVTVAALT